jgi:hypothetical protein
MNDMQYINVKVPATTAWLDTDKDIFIMLEALVGDDCEPCGEPLNYNASIGRSAYGPWVEGDIEFTKGGKWLALHYDFMLINEDTARVFRYCID